MCAMPRRYWRFTSPIYVCTWSTLHFTLHSDGPTSRLHRNRCLCSRRRSLSLSPSRSRRSATKTALWRHLDQGPGIFQSAVRRLDSIARTSRDCLPRLGNYYVDLLQVTYIPRVLHRNIENWIWKIHAEYVRYAKCFSTVFFRKLSTSARVIFPFYTHRETWRVQN